MNHEHLVFVYGTLRAGYSNHHLLAGHGRGLGPARTLASHALYLDDYPYLVREPAHGPVIGEIYAVDRATLASLDELEEHPHWYCRELTPVLDARGQVLQAWVYFFPQARGRLLESGDLAQVAGYHGLGPRQGP